MPELIEKIRQYRECKLMIEELEQEANAVADEIKAVHATGQPVLAGTVSIEKSEKWSLEIPYTEKITELT